MSFASNLLAGLVMTEAAVDVVAVVGWMEDGWPIAGRLIVDTIDTLLPDMLCTVEGCKTEARISLFIIVRIVESRIYRNIVLLNYYKNNPA